jgi:branched-subunit amino acid ABC-type transport system permease component
VINTLVVQCLNGIAIGLLFALVAVGLTIVLGLMGVLNFAHGSFYMLGGYVTYAVFASIGNFWLGLVAAALVSAAAGVVLFFTIVRPLTVRSPLEALLALVGVSMIFVQGARTIWGPDPKLLPIPFGSLHVELPGLDFHYPVYLLLAMGLAIVILAALSLMFRRTNLGVRCLAAIQDREIAATMGVNVGRVSALMFTLGMGVAGLAGGLAGPVFSVHPNMGIELIGMMFVIAIVGGMGSIGGTVIAAIIIAMTKSLSSIYISGNVADILAYTVLLAILLIRPRGIMGLATVMD